MDAISILLKAIVTVISAVTPPLKKRLAERKAGLRPDAVSAFFGDDLMDDALRRLGSIQASDPWWKTFSVNIEARALRPETFCKPAVREWISRAPVREDLKAAATAKLGQSEIPNEIWERLVASFTSPETTGEHRSYAESAINTAVAFLQNSVQGSVSDPSAAAITQATDLTTRTILQEEIGGLAEVAGLKKNPHFAPPFTEKARNRLDKILRRRASPGQNTAEDLRNLLIDFGDGQRLEAADRAVKQETQLWLARVEAVSGHPESAESTLSELVAAGFPVPQAAWGQVDLGKLQPALALQRLRDLQDMDSRTVTFHVLLKSHGASSALAFLDEIKPNDSSSFTPTGWHIICVTLIQAERFDDAVSYLKMLQPDVLEKCTHLYYMYAVSCLLPMVPPDRYKSVMRNGFSCVLEHLLDGPDAHRARDNAMTAAKKAFECARAADDYDIAERCENGIRSLRLLDPSKRQDEILAIQAQMKEPAFAVKLIWLVDAHGISFNSEPLERYLAQCKKMGGLNPDQLLAELHLLSHPAKRAELVRFLDDEWKNLLPYCNPQELIVRKVQALVDIQDIDGASAFFDARRPDIEPAVSARLELMLRGARGEDASDNALELFKMSNAIDDLVNLVRILEVKKHWQRLAPLASELFARQPNFETAMFRLRCMQQTQASASEVNDFLKSTVAIVEQRPEVRSARALALLEAGEHLEAKRLNDELICERHSATDIALDVNIAIRTGDWERFSLISAKALEKQYDLQSQMLLSLAKLAGFTDPSQAVALAFQAVERDGDNPAVLLGAHQVAIAARRDDIAMPWVHKAAELSKNNENGLIRSFAYKDMIEFMSSQAESWRQKNEMYRKGEVPIHMAASMFNASLTQLLVGTPRLNSNEVDVRRRQPTPIRSGKRRAIPAGGFRRIALDITALFILSELGRLKSVIQIFDAIFISPRVMENLLSDREKVVFHQPSRIAELKPIKALLDAGRLKVIENSGDQTISEKVGEEAASLLKAAQTHGGQFIHPGALFDVSSQMEKHAELGALAALVIDPIDVANALVREGGISGTKRDQAIDYLLRTGSIARRDVIIGAPLFIDGIALENLHHAKLLQPLINSGHTVSIHKNKVDEWRALLETEPKTEENVAALNNIRLALREGLLSGKVQFLTQSKRLRGKVNEIALLPLMDLFEDASLVEAAVIDDRMLADNSQLTDSNGITVPVLSSLDILDALVTRGIMRADEYREALHTLRTRCFFCIPIPADDLLHNIEGASVNDGQVQETAELRGIREHLARLHSTDVLCTQSDLEYLDSVWSSGSHVIARLWANETIPFTETVARANWIVANVIPNIELVMRFSPDGAKRISQVAATWAGLTLHGITRNVKLRQAKLKWLEESRLAPLLPANSDVLDEIATQAAHALVRRTQEIAIEFERINR